tara:strand:+ start:131 stop:274 length:144 start_codon:yes stop_codon:yes gene_type:complete
MNSRENYFKIYLCLFYRKRGKFGNNSPILPKIPPTVSVMAVIARDAS